MISKREREWHTHAHDVATKSLTLRFSTERRQLEGEIQKKKVNSYMANTHRNFARQGERARKSERERKHALRVVLSTLLNKASSWEMNERREMRKGRLWPVECGINWETSNFFQLFFTFLLFKNYNLSPFYYYYFFFN